MNLKKSILIRAITAFLLTMGADSNAQERYTPDWESLSKYKTPEWFRDAKFGIFIHWGVYSVPAYRNEWYPRNIYRRQSPEHKYHVAQYGFPKDFGYKDFIPGFQAENWAPAKWAKLFRESGAKYVVPVAEHHDGFPMYECSYTEFNAVKMGPKRDIIRELLDACHKEGLKAGVSSHRAFNWEFYAQEEDFDTYNESYAGLYGHRRTQKRPDEAFVNDWYLRTKELAVKYKPDIIWFDFYLDQPELHEARYQLAADYYNESLTWKKEVVLQYKYDTYHPKVGVLDIERGKLSDIRKLPWQTDTSISRRGWCYIQSPDPDYKPAGLLIDDLVDIVSKNGNLLLNIGPKPDGTIPEEQQIILLEIGKWLKVNGESIYGTRPWYIYGEGPTITTEGAHREQNNKGGTPKDYRFTVKENTLYATCMGWPDTDFSIESLGKKSVREFHLKIKNISLLGYGQPLDWKQYENNLSIKRPRQMAGAHAFVFKIEIEGLQDQMRAYEENRPEEPETIYCFPGNSLRIGDGYSVRDGNLNQWDSDEVLRWQIKVVAPGTYGVNATQNNFLNEKYSLKANGQELVNPDQSAQKKYIEVYIGNLRFEKAGNYELTLEAKPENGWDKKLSIKKIELVKLN